MYIHVYIYIYGRKERRREEVMEGGGERGRSSRLAVKKEKWVREKTQETKDIPNRKVQITLRYKLSSIRLAKFLKTLETYIKLVKSGTLIYCW